MWRDLFSWPVALRVLIGAIILTALLLLYRRLIAVLTELLEQQRRQSRQISGLKRRIDQHEGMWREGKDDV